MSILDNQAFIPALKTLYTDKEIRNLVYKNNPFLAMVPKFEGFTGDARKIPLIYGNPQNRSAQFGTALSIGSTSLLQAFFLTRAPNYSVGEVANETILASQNDSGAFMRALKLEVDGALNSLARSLATQLYRNGTGWIGQISSTSGTGTTLTLADPEQSVNFEVGMALEANATLTNPITLTTTGQQGVITAIDRINGIITLSQAIPGMAVSYYLFPRGDGLQGTLSGLDAWIPFANRNTVLAAPFFQVTRNTDTTRLGGQYFDGSSLSLEEGMQQLLRYVYREGGRPDYFFVNSLIYQNLIISLGSKVQYVNVKAGDIDVGFEGVQIHYPGGRVTVLADQNCPDNYGYALEMRTWEMASLGKAVNLFKGDGLDVLRSATNDSLQFRCYSYSNLACYAPGFNGVIQFPSFPY